MYKNFFGFKERPFKLVPNPEYLYLSRSHEEALAHLVYAASQGDGFVEITGEVGTGKTTLCRAFLEGLDEKSITAYIFNPKLDALQLLKAINDEFGIDSSPGNTKELIDALNGFLMGKKAEGKNVILLIDEAQNLSKDVLEQLRLLSNLETEKRKLFQVVLFGQPELDAKLRHQSVRQFLQRVTFHYHLAPLNSAELDYYVSHRLRVAGYVGDRLFTRAALRALYRASAGVPRLINVLAHKSMLAAYGEGRHYVSGAHVAKAAADTPSARSAKTPWGLTAAMAAVLAVTAGAVYWYALR